MMTIFFFVKFVKIWKNIPLLLASKGQLKNQNQIQNLLSDHNKLKFRDGFLYHDDLLYVFDGLVRLQDFQTLNMTYWLQAILDSTRPWS